MAPEGGLQWRQLAQDGVQFANSNYQDSLNQPIYIAPGNRVDLLVKAPLSATSTSILVQPVMGRSQVKPTPADPTPPGGADPKPGVVLMSVTVAGPAVIPPRGQQPEMQFLQQAPRQPKFLQDIGVDELMRNNFTTQKLIFGSKPPGTAEQHTINGIQFQNGQALVTVPLGAVQEWKIVNTTNGVTGPGTIDHPFHIHVNPFQITEVFDPNEKLVDPETGQLEKVLVNDKTQAVPRYVTSAADFSTNEAFKKRQCLLDIRDENTWKPCGPATAPSNLVWWDVFAIPSARVPVDVNNKPIAGPDGKPIVIPGFFRMRSRFVDYPGLYVLHCHILVHEDRGMMFSVRVGQPTVSLVKHH
jgi:FtsP/CotA-like multicopper oxidase with cupredoxin domain